MRSLTIAAPHDVPTYVAESEDDAILFRSWMGARTGVVLGLDSETNAVDPWDRGYECRAIQVSDGTQAWIVQPEPWVGPILRRHPKFVGHFTAKAEVPFIERALPGAIRLGELDPHIIDYQVAQAIEDPRTLLPRKDGVDVRLIHDKGLKATYARKVSPCLSDADVALHAWFHDNAPKGHRTPKKMATWGYANIPFWTPEYLTYSAMDAVAVKVLYDMDERELRRRGEWSHAEYEFLLQWDIDNMVFRGEALDPPYVRWLNAELQRRVDAEAGTLAAHGVPPSGMGASVHAAFAALGVEPVKWNEGRDGKPPSPCWDKEAIAEVIDAEERSLSGLTDAAALADSILTVRRASKFRTTYVVPMLDALERDCRLHPQFRSIGTVTHRNSASAPPVQQMPKKDTMIRAAFGGVPGWVWVTCDLEQGEPRTMAGLSGDPAYVAAVLSGDVNNASATAAFGAEFIPAEGKTPGTKSYMLRQGAKAGFLAVCYGVGLKKLASTMKLAVTKVAETRAGWQSAFRVMFTRAARMNTQPFVRLPSGRTINLWDRYFVTPAGDVFVGDRPSRKALNYETQGAQADWVKAAWLKLRVDWNWALSIFMHDEIGLFVPESLAEQACAALKAAMEGPIGHGVTMLATPEINGRTWAPQPSAFSADEMSIVDQEAA